VLSVHRCLLAAMVDVDKLTPIVESLEGIAAKKELRPKSAYQLFCKEKFAAAKANKTGGAKSFKDIGALWKTMSAKQKEPYEKMHKDAIAKASAVKKEWGQAFDKHWATLEKHLEAEEKLHGEKMKKRDADRKDKALQKKRVKTEKKKQLSLEKKRRASFKRGVTAPRASRAVSGVSSAARIKELSRGLDTSVWEVRESTSRPGFFYYLNKRTRESTADRPKASRQPDGAGPPAQRQRVR